ncbi:hypothetical protein A2U01_0063125, partial [Trifolium medium]|nr:hypothetical protein [Trifolium medium]
MCNNIVSIFFFLLNTAQYSVSSYSLINHHHSAAVTFSVTHHRSPY